MSEKIIKRIGPGNFYLLSFVIGSALFYLLQILIMSGLVKYFAKDNPVFLESFRAALIDNSLMTEQMWAVQNLSQFSGELILTIIIIVFLGRELIKHFQKFRLEWKANLSMIISGFFIIFLANYALNILYDIIGIEVMAENQELIEASLKSSSGFYMLIVVFLFAPFVEEILFRKLLYGVVEEKFNLKPIYAVIISAVLFAAMHALDIFFFQYLAMALVLCATYALSKNNILVPMGIHFLNNSTVLIFYY